MAGSDFPALRASSYTFSFPLFDNDGNPKASATITSSKVSKDQGALAASTNSVTELAEGLYNLTLTATEMTADEVVVKVISSDAKPMVAIIRTVVRQMKDLSFPSSSGTNQMVDLRDNLVAEGTVTLRQALRVFLAALAGKVSGAETATVTFRDTTDAKDRIVCSEDEDGNRTAVTLDLS